MALDSVAVASEDAAWYGDGLAVVDGEGMEDREGEEGDIEMDGEMTVGEGEGEGQWGGEEGEDGRGGGVWV